MIEGWQLVTSYRVWNKGILHLASFCLHFPPAVIQIGGMAILGLLLVPLLHRQRFLGVAGPMLSPRCSSRCT